MLAILQCLPPRVLITSARRSQSALQATSRQQELPRNQGRGSFASQSFASSEADS